MADDGRRGWDRRGVLTGGLVAAGGLMIYGGDWLSQQPWFTGALDEVEGLNRRAFRALAGGDLAREYPESAISAYFKPNGTTFPRTPEYVAMRANGFADWRLRVGGMVEAPLALSLAELRAMPARTQITRHDCVEGWSCIGKWTGVPLGLVLDRARPRPGARYVVFRCADRLFGDYYYESIDMVDAYHPQTILAYAMNGQALPVPHGAPLRVRIERQLGYKMAKYVMAVDVVDSLAPISGGKGGFWEDRGYTWYAGI